MAVRDEAADKGVAPRAKSGAGRIETATGAALRESGSFFALFLGKIPVPRQKHSTVLLVAALIAFCLLVVAILLIGSGTLSAILGRLFPSPQPDAPATPTTTTAAATVSVELPPSEMSFGYSASQDEEAQLRIAASDWDACQIEGAYFSPIRAACMPERRSVVPHEQFSRCAKGVVCFSPASAARVLWQRFSHGLYRFECSIRAESGSATPICALYNRVYSLEELVGKRQLRANNNGCFSIDEVSKVIRIVQKPAAGYSSADITTEFEFRDSFVVLIAFRMKRRVHAEVPSLTLSFCNPWQRSSTPVLSVVIPDGHTDQISIKTVEDDRRKRKLQAETGGATGRYREQFETLRTDQLVRLDDTPIDDTGESRNCILFRVAPRADQPEWVDCSVHFCRDAAPSLTDNFIGARVVRQPGFRWERRMSVQLAVSKGADVTIDALEIAEMAPATQQPVLARRFPSTQ